MHAGALTLPVKAPLCWSQRPGLQCQFIGECACTVTPALLVKEVSLALAESVSLRKSAEAAGALLSVKRVFVRLSDLQPST